MLAGCTSSNKRLLWDMVMPFIALGNLWATKRFLHLVGDHLYVTPDYEDGCAQQLVEVAQAESCAVSAVQASREQLLPYYGAIGGRRVPGRQDLYLIETVIEKPTPTESRAKADGAWPTRRSLPLFLRYARADTAPLWIY